MVKNLPAMWETEFDPWVGKIPWRRKWQPSPVFTPRESCGQRSPTGYGPWGYSKESDTTEQLTHTRKCLCMLSCFSRVQLCMTLWTVACQAPRPMGFSRQEYWDGLLAPRPGEFPDPGIGPVSLISNLHWQVGSLPLVPSGKPQCLK